MGKADIISASKKQVDFTKAFTSLSLFQSGPSAQKDTKLGKNSRSAKFELDCDMAILFPYLNAEIGGAQYFSKPECIKFMHNDHLCVLYPQEGAFTPAINHIDATDFLWEILKLIRDIARRSDEIIPNFRRHNSVSAVDIFRLLPGSNCRDCGYATCLAFAAALSRQKTFPVECPYLPNPIEEKSVFQVIDKEGRLMQTLSLAIDTSGLHREISQKEVYIQKLQARLTEFEQSRIDSLEFNNAKLLSPLTKREIEVLRMAAHGATNKEISKKLYVSEHTVKSHIIHIFDKLGVNDRTQASVWAAKMGFL